MPNLNLPKILVDSLGSEVQDFAVKAKKAYPASIGLSMLVFSIIWLTVNGIIASVFLVPLLQGEVVETTFNEQLVSGSLDNLQPILLPVLLNTFFLIIGIGLTVASFYFLLKSGGYFVGTPQRLYILNGSKLDSIEWDLFSGKNTVTGSSQFGNITLELRASQENKPRRTSSLVATDKIFLQGIQNPYQVEKLCRQRIQQNDAN